MSVASKCRKRNLGIRLSGDAVAQVTPGELDDPHPEHVPEGLAEVLVEGLVPGGGDGAHGWHEDEMEEHPDGQPNTTPCHSLTRGYFSASSAYTTAKKIENPKWTMKLTKGSGHPLKVYDM